MRLVFHTHVQLDINRAQRHYDEIDWQLGDDLWSELERCFEMISSSPERFHFDPSGWRRCSLKRFPYHILFEIRADYIKVMTLRHDRQNPEFGTKRR